jgi:hypothetical protein
MTQEELKLVLDALLHAYHEDEAHPRTLEAITAIKEALAQPEQEPVAYSGNGTAGREADVRPTGFCFQMPQRTWVGLTDEEIAQGWKESWVTEQAFQSAVWWAEEKLKEKNNG